MMEQRSSPWATTSTTERVPDLGGRRQDATSGFDTVIMVDWSSNNGPKRGKDSIWVAVGTRSGSVRATNHPTRREADLAVTAELDRALETDQYVLLGYDFGFGYPAGFAGNFGGHGRPWQKVWAWFASSVTDTDKNVNNRFTVANDLNAKERTAFFWGVPKALPALSPRLKEPPPGLAPNPLGTYRVTELAAARQCGKSIKSVWQLFGGVTVGSQVLTGIPYLERLRRRYGSRLAVWPQQTGFCDDPFAEPPGFRILMVEIWPTAFVPVYADEAGERDEQQVCWAVRSCFHQQVRGDMPAWYNPASVQDMTPSQAQAVRDEEGWILCVL